MSIVVVHDGLASMRLTAGCCDTSFSRDSGMAAMAMLPNWVYVRQPRGVSTLSASPSISTKTMMSPLFSRLRACRCPCAGIVADCLVFAACRTHGDMLLRCASTAMVHSMVAIVSNNRFKSFLLVMLQKYEYFQASARIRDILYNSVTNGGNCFHFFPP